MLPLDGLGMDASRKLTPESLADPPEGRSQDPAVSVVRRRRSRASPCESRRRPGRSEKDFDGRRFWAAAAQELGGEVQVDGRGLCQLTSSVPSVACALELLFTPQEHAFGFGVEIEVLKFRRSHRSLEFGRDPASVVPLEGDFELSSG